jgi:hypothetical protein
MITKTTGVSSARSRTRIVAVALLAVSMLAGAGLFVVVEHTTWQLAEQREYKARQTILSTLVFESLYAVMRAGGGVDVLQNTILRLENRLRDHSLYLVRGEAVVREYGDLAQNGRLRDLPQVAAALQQGIASTEWAAEGLRRSAMPVRFRHACLACHSQASAGAIAAIIVTEQRVDRPRGLFGDSTLAIYLYVVVAVPLLLFLAYRLGTVRSGER